MFTNVRKMNDGLIRISTWRDNRNYFKNPLKVPEVCYFQMIYHHTQDVSLCRFISRSCGLGILETDGVIQIISGVIRLSVVVRVRVEGHLLLNGSRRWLLHWFLFLLYRRWWWWYFGDYELHGPGWGVDQAVGVPEGVAVILHALEDANGAWWGLFLHDWWRRRRWWGRLLWWRGRKLRHCFRLWGFLRGTVGVVSGVTEDRHCTSGHVNYVGLAERVLPIT